MFVLLSGKPVKAKVHNRRLIGLASQVNHQRIKSVGIARITPFLKSVYIKTGRFVGNTDPFRLILLLAQRIVDCKDPLYVHYMTLMISLLSQVPVPDECLSWNGHPNDIGLALTNVSFFIFFSFLFIFFPRFDTPNLNVLQ